MKVKQYKKVTFSGIPEESKELLMTEVSFLTELGVEEVDGSTISTYFEDKDYSEEAIQLLSEKYQSQVEITSFIEENWNAKWEASITPIEVGNFCTIRASFHETPEDTQYDIIITPKMSFGTGHHATTYQVIEQMQQIEFSGTTVLDFGTGTGVLGILAAKMGAKDVVAIDNDEWSIDNAAENALKNQVNWTLLQGSMEVAPDKSYDVILANINLHILKAYAHDLYKSLCVDGDLLISGILATDIEELSATFEVEGFKHHFTSLKDNWVMMHWKK